MSQNDLRVRRTHKFVRHAFMELLKEKGFDALTVQDIVDRAMINRATFYRHYQDKYDLVTKMVDEMLAELIARMEPPPATREQVALERPPEAWVKLFAYLRENALLYRLVLTQGGVSAFRKHMQSVTDDLIHERLSELWKRSPQPRMPFDVIAGYSSSAFLGMLVWWLDHDVTYTPEQMATWLQQLIVLGPYYGLGLPAPFPEST